MTLDFSELMAGDLTGRARAFQSLMGDGMAVDQAAALSDLLMRSTSSCDKRQTRQGRRPDLARLGRG